MTIPDQERIEKIANKLRWMAAHSPNMLQVPEIQDMLYLLEVVYKAYPRPAVQELIEIEQEEVESEEDDQVDD